MKEIITTLSLSLLTLVSFGKSAQAFILLSDDFDTENSGVGLGNYDSFNNWDVTDGSVDLYGSAGSEVFPGNGLYVEMDGSTNNAGTLTSKTQFSFNQGETVNLTFDILGVLGSNSESMTVSLGSIFSQTFNQDDSGLQTIDAFISSPISANLVFDHAGGDNAGLVIDNIELSTSVPFEFSPTMGLVFSLGMFGLHTYRKKTRLD